MATAEILGDTTVVMSIFFLPFMVPGDYWNITFSKTYNVPIIVESIKIWLQSGFWAVMQFRWCCLRPPPEWLIRCTWGHLRPIHVTFKPLRMREKKDVRPLDTSTLQSQLDCFTSDRLWWWTEAKQSFSQTPRPDCAWSHSQWSL